MVAPTRNTAKKTTTPRKTAAKKAPAAKTPAVAGSKEVMSPADIQAQMAAEMEKVKDRIGTLSGNKIQIKQDKTFALPDGSILDEVEVVILDFTNRNAFYEGAYDPNNITAPVCYAYGPVISDLIPATNVEEKQADSCEECPMNVFGSDGKGKACKNNRRLAVLPADPANANDPIMTIDVSPTAIKRFDKLVSDLQRDAHVLPIAVQVLLKFNEASTYPSLEFELIGNNEALPQHWARRAEAAELINQPIDYSAFEQEEQKPAKRTATTRKANPRRR